MHMAKLVESQLSPFAEAGPRLTMVGPGVMLAAATAQPIGLALHELATNAAKYGAWSAEQGHVQVRWTFGDDEGALRLHWTESGGPVVVPPTRMGFGQIVNRDLVARAVDGVVEAEFAPEGLRWTLTIPARYLVEITQSNQSTDVM